MHFAAVAGGASPYVLRVITPLLPAQHKINVIQGFEVSSCLEHFAVAVFERVRGFSTGAAYESLGSLGC